MAPYKEHYGYEATGYHHRHTPRCIRHTTMPEPINATPAVINHPPITEITPVILNTALSRPHARSASEVPIATMKVTKVVESGSLRVVAPRYEHTGEHEVDRSAHEVKRRSLLRLLHPGVEPARYPCLEAGGSVLLDAGDGIDGVAHQSASGLDEPNISSFWLWALSPTVVCVT